MRRYLNIRALMLVVWGALALALTMLPNTVPFVGRVSRVIGGTSIGSAVGHAGLFGMLMLMLYLALRIRLSSVWSLLLAVIGTLLVSTGTEIFQVVLADRDASLVDMLANWLGIFAMGFFVSVVGSFVEEQRQKGRSTNRALR
jgi:VanZ family protein